METMINNAILNNYNNAEYYEEVMANCPWTLEKFKDHVDNINIQYFVKHCKHLASNIIDYIIND